MATRTIVFPNGLVSAKSMSDVFLPVTGWTSTNGLRGVRAALEMNGKIGNITVAPAYQVTNEPFDPGTSTSLANSAGLSADGFSYPSDYDDPTSNTDGNQYECISA